MPEVYANDFETTLTAQLSLNGLTCTVAAAAPAALQGGSFRARIEDADEDGNPAGTNVEYVRITAGQAGLSWTIDRNIEPPGAQVAHGPGSVVTHVLTVGGLGGLVSSSPDATGSVKGLVKLAGALGGTADSPTVPGLSSKADQSALASEVTTRTNADSSLSTAIALKADTTALTAEATARTNADNTLTTALGLKADLVSGHVPPGQIGSGARDGTKVLRDDGSWQPAPSGSSNVPNPQRAGQVPISTAAGPSGWSVQDAATPSDEIPMPDTEDGSPGDGPGYVKQGASAPRSLLYAASGRDVTAVVGSSGDNLTVANTDVAQLTVVTLDDDCHFTFPDEMLGAHFKLITKQGGGGGFVVTFPVNLAWAGDVEPTFSTGAGAIDFFDFICFDGVNWLGTTSATGGLAPPVPMQIVQSVTTPSFGDMSFAAPVSVGSAVLCVRTIVFPGENSGAAPSGGGCTSWAQIGTAFDGDALDHQANGAIEVWLGTNSSGGEGSEVLHSNQQSIGTKFYEISGVAADVGDAVSDVTMSHIANMGATNSGPNGWNQWIPDAVTSDRDGQMPIFVCSPVSFLYGSGDSNYQAILPSAPWVNDIEHLTYQGTRDDVIFSYQPSTAEGQSYAPTYLRRNDNGNAFSVSALGFLLNPPA